LRNEIKTKTSIVSNIISWIIFLTTLALTIISLIPAIFPNLLVRSFSNIEDKLGLDLFELGIWALPLITTNLIILVLIITYRKGKLPTAILKPFKFISNFEISSQIAFFVIVILLGIYISLSIQELFDGKYEADYYLRVQDRLDNFSITEISDAGLGKHIELLLVFSSVKLFGNDKVIPFIGSIGLLIATYYASREITQKRFAGILSFVIVLQSFIFLKYDTSVAYTNFWILFFITSLYLVYKQYAISPIFFLLAILTKALSISFLPMSILFILKTQKSSKIKKMLILSFFAVIALIIILIFTTRSEIAPTLLTTFDPYDFWSGFSAFYISARLDGLVLLFMLPLVFGLFFSSKKGFGQADSILFLIMAMLLIGPFLQGFSDHHNVPYRYVPMIVFFAIGVGILFSKRVNQQLSKFSNKQ